MICRLLARAQQGDEEAMLELINRFQPLLKKYAKKLRYDDAYEDCLLFFIELVKTMDLKKLNTMQDQSIAAYIKVSVTHFYSKKTRRIFEKEREIARKYHKSRQTVNQLKMRTLKKLREMENGGDIKYE